MKQSVLIASVLGGGVALGAVVVAGVLALTHKSDPQQQVAAASAPVAVAQAAPAMQPGVANVAAGATPANPAGPQYAAYADVLSARPITVTVHGTKTECHQQQVVRQAPVQDEHHLTGTVLGSVLGGVLGHQVGGGNGKKVATVAGAALGGYAGNRVQDHMQKADTYTDTENRCSQVPTTTRKVVGYQVRYSLDGQTGTIRMNHRPGERIPARNGQLLVSQMD